MAVAGVQSDDDVGTKIRDNGDDGGLHRDLIGGGQRPDRRTTVDARVLPPEEVHSGHAQDRRRGAQFGFPKGADLIDGERGSGPSAAGHLTPLATSGADDERVDTRGGGVSADRSAPERFVVRVGDGEEQSQEAGGGRISMP
jgi:hypothetical protein